MSITGVGNTGATAQTQAPAASQSAQDLQNQFLLLLVTQLQHQDPLNPMDSADFTSQLAQFSSLEQLTQVNTGLKALTAAQNSMQNAYLVNLIGKEVIYESSSPNGEVKVLQGTVTGISYDSDGTYFIINGTERTTIGSILQVMQPQA